MAISFEKHNTQVLKVVCDDIGSVFYKHGSFIGGESLCGRNFDFTDIVIGTDQNIAKGVVKNVGRKFTGEDIHLMKCTYKGPSVTYFADNCRNVSIINLKPKARITIQAQYLLAFTDNCEQSLRVTTDGLPMGAGFVSTTITAKSADAYVAISSSGNTVTLCNDVSSNTLFADPQALVCWYGADPDIVLDLDAKMLVGRSSGESYMFSWPPDKKAYIVLQPFEGDAGSMVPDDGKEEEGVTEAARDVVEEVVTTVAGV